MGPVIRIRRLQRQFPHRGACLRHRARGCDRRLALPPRGNPCSAGWYDVGGTSASSPQWAGLVAIADQIAGHGLGQINSTLYTLASGANYSNYFYDVTNGNNQADPAVPGYPATTGWDPVTGLGTPNAANLVPALAGH